MHFRAGGVEVAKEFVAGAHFDQPDTVLQNRAVWELRLWRRRRLSRSPRDPPEHVGTSKNSTAIETRGGRQTYCPKPTLERDFMGQGSVDRASSTSFGDPLELPRGTHPNDIVIRPALERRPLQLTTPSSAFAATVAPIPSRHLSPFTRRGEASHVPRFCTTGAYRESLSMGGEGIGS